MTTQTPTSDGKACDLAHGREGVFSDPDFKLPDAPATDPRPWSAAEADALVEGHDQGRELRCPIDGAAIDVTSRHEQGRPAGLTLDCPVCGNTHAVTGRG